MASLNVTSVQGFGVIFLTALIAGIFLSIVNEFVLNPIQRQIA